MSSIIEEYSYDIFISYRQKDNKHDGWVTEFVNNLKGEIESTFKEDISIYFDANPKDGLLEIHVVDGSLSTKLKSLIFIPVISQTYCDSKSYAWQHEFCTFNKLAKEDRFGRDIRLPGGNVASRILPVKIHDLDPEDKTLLENEIGGVLRCIEFIYKSAGVNRPLRANEEHPQDNLNKTYYRDQINKVANAIKEIINGIRQKAERDFKVLPQEQIYKEDITSEPPVWWKNKKKFTLTTALVISLLFGIWLVYHYVFMKDSTKEELEKSVAVLPFRNDSPDSDEENTSFTNGLMEEILINLQAIVNLRVLGRTSVEQFRNNDTKTIPEIARELGVNYIVEGSVQKSGNIIRLRVQLIKSKGKEDHIWAKSYEEEINPDNLFRIQSQIAEAIATELQVVITPEEKQIIEKAPTTNIEALVYYRNGKEELGQFTLKTTNGSDAQLVLNNRLVLERANRQFKKALELDSTFALPYIGLARVQMNMLDGLDSILLLCDKATYHDNKLYEAYILKGYYYWAKGNNSKAVENFDKALSINSNSWEAYYYKERLYQGILDQGINSNQSKEASDLAKSTDDLHNNIPLNKKSELPNLAYELSRIFRYSEFYEQSNNLMAGIIKNSDSATYSSHN